MLLPDVPSNLQEEARVLQTWAIERGANSGQLKRIVALLHTEWMLNIPLPPRTQRKPSSPDYLWWRYLFRRHVQHILKWKQRREESDLEGFSYQVNNIIRHKLFPEPTILKHGALEVGSEKACKFVSSAGEVQHGESHRRVLGNSSCCSCLIATTVTNDSSTTECRIGPDPSAYASRGCSESCGCNWSGSPLR